MSKVSVILPTYNRSSLLALAIQSVLEQSYRDFELIVVDDGSRDDTSEVVARFGDPRIVYIRQENAGRSAARNRGLAQARGTYIAFLDDDDLFHPDKLALQVGFLEDSPGIDLVASGARLINERGEVIGAFRGWEMQAELRLLDCLYSCPLMPSVVLFRPSVLARMDHWFDKELEPAEDTDFFLRMLLVGSRMAWLREELSAYRIHPNSSQHDAARYIAAWQLLLDKFFSRSDIPLEALSHRNRVYTCYSLSGACHAYATGQVGIAHRGLLQAVSLDPSLLEGVLPPVVEAVAGFADSFRVANPHRYIHFVFDHLPAELAHLRRYRGEALGALHMGRVFRAARSGLRPSLSDWLKGVWHAPRWLRNRSVLSIAAQALLGKRLSAALKQGIRWVRI